MNQKFTKQDDGKIKWEYFKEDSTFEDKDLGKLGTKGGYDFIIFNSKEDAMKVLDRDVLNVEANIEKYISELDKNKHNLDTFQNMKDLLDQVQELRANPKANKKAMRFIEVMGALNNEYQKYLNSKQLKIAYDFNVEQLTKIKEQIEELNKL